MSSDVLERLQVLHLAYKLRLENCQEKLQLSEEMLHYLMAILVWRLGQEKKDMFQLQEILIQQRLLQGEPLM